MSWFGRLLANNESRSVAQVCEAFLQNQVMQDFLQYRKGRNQSNHIHLEVEAVMGNTLVKLSRYQSALRRDLYRTIEMLRTVQTERRERHKRHERREREE